MWYYTPDKLSYNEGAISATGQTLRLFDNPAHFFETGSFEERHLSEFDVVLMRQDPPFDMNYISATHFLERIHPEVLVVNDPIAVRNAPEKIFPVRFEGLLPPTLMTRDRQALTDFRAAYGDMILKPVFGNGGAGVFRLRACGSTMGGSRRTDFAS